MSPAPSPGRRSPHHALGTTLLLFAAVSLFVGLLLWVSLPEADGGAVGVVGFYLAAFLAVLGLAFRSHRPS